MVDQSSNFFTSSDFGFFGTSLLGSVQKSALVSMTHLFGGVYELGSERSTNLTTKLLGISTSAGICSGLCRAFSSCLVVQGLAFVCVSQAGSEEHASGC